MEKRITSMAINSKVIQQILSGKAKVFKYFEDDGSLSTIVINHYRSEQHEGRKVFGLIWSKTVSKEHELYGKFVSETDDPEQIFYEAVSFETVEELDGYVKAHNLKI